MNTPASIGRHPVHPMLVSLPIGLWTFSLVSDLVYRFGGGAEVWDSVAFYTLAGGVAGALLAAVPGFIDLLALPAGKVKKVAVAHMAANLGAVVLFAVNLGLRLNAAPGAAVPVLLSAIGIALLGVAGWLGGELVYVHGVGVQPAPDRAPGSSPHP
ncbi:MAG TPA: DUF2231 domain-containing protein [Vicinamibacteria bacterium]|nr:DUF2231 domain-containing protein [Vicinamibacteria bacterium]